MLYHGNEVVLPSGESIDFPIYLRGAAFFEEFLARPGGLAELIGARCCQYYYYTNLGPLILTAVAWLAYLSSDWLIRISGGTGSRCLRFVPPLLVLITYNQYTFHLENYVALIAALMSATVYLFVADRVDNGLVKLLVFTVVSVAVYYAAGGLYVLFAVLCGVSELFNRRRYVLGGLYLLAAVGIPLVGKYQFDASFADAYFRASGISPFQETPLGASAVKEPPSGAYSSEESWSGIQPVGATVKVAALSALYLFFVLAAVILPFRRGLARLASAVSSRTGKVGRYLFNEKLRIAYAVSSLALASALVAWYTLDKNARTALRANYLARMELWGEFLEEVEHYPPSEYPVSLMADVNRALYETGQLGSRMFSYPQNVGVLFELGKDAASLKGGCEVLYRLGRINEAEHAALEALEIKGERPEILRLLADVYVVKRRPEVARVFLRVLSKDLIHGPWADERLRRLDDDPLLSSDPEIRDLRSVMPRTDMVVKSKELKLLALLARNRKNRMAFEYLMAYYLLNKQPAQIACHISRLDDFDYPAIPEHYAEAVLLYFHNVNRPLEVPGWPIDQRTLEKYREIVQISRDCRNDKQAMRKILAARFPNSAYRYFLVGESGGAR